MALQQAAHPRQLLRRGEIGVRDPNLIRPLQVAPGLAQHASRQQVRGAEVHPGAHERDVEIPRHPKILIAVIKHGDLGAAGGKKPDYLLPPLAHSHRHGWQRVSDFGGFIATFGDGSISPGTVRGK
jgi:hypothetical protein